MPRKNDPSWPAWADMAALRLEEGPSAGTVIEVAPTMVNITHKGERYFRMQGTRYEDPTTGRILGCYLWEGWGPQKRRELGIEDTSAV